MEIRVGKYYKFTERHKAQPCVRTAPDSVVKDGIETASFIAKVTNISDKGEYKYLTYRKSGNGWGTARWYDKPCNFGVVAIEELPPKLEAEYEAAEAKRESERKVMEAKAARAGALDIGFIANQIVNSRPDIRKTPLYSEIKNTMYDQTMSCSRDEAISCMVQWMKECFFGGMGPLKPELYTRYIAAYDIHESLTKTEN